MGLGRLQGTPWHVEQMHRKEDEMRRYKGRCIYYDDETGHCSYRCEKCIGSAHCLKYEPMTDEEFKKKQAEMAQRAREQKKTASVTLKPEKKETKKVLKSKKSVGEDDCYWY